MFNFKLLLYVASVAATCTPDFGILSASKAFTISTEGKTVGYNANNTDLAGAAIIAFDGVSWLAAGTGATDDSNPFRICVPGQESFCITQDVAFSQLHLQPRVNASAEQLFFIECDSCDSTTSNEGCQLTYAGTGAGTGYCLDLELGQGVLADCAEIGKATITWSA